LPPQRGQLQFQMLDFELRCLQLRLDAGERREPVSRCCLE
jgi:hypothetical protein